jgi:hypothetical protein
VDGVLVEADSVGAWGATLQRCSDDRGLVERLQRGVRPPRTMDDVADDMAALYRCLPRRHAAGRRAAAGAPCT